jgi:hypothetical protein
MQARTARIMRFSLPHDPDGRPCLPTHHPRSQPPSPNSSTPIPANSTTPRPRTCWPTWPASPTHDPPVAAATRWSPSWAWRPPRCWSGRGRSPRSPSGPPTRPAGPGRARRPPPRSWPLQRPGRGHHRPHASRLAADVLAGAIGAWLADRDRQRDRDRPGPANLSAGGGRRRQDAARRPCGGAVTAARCTCSRRWTTKAERCWAKTQSAAPLRRSPRSPRCLSPWTLTAWWSPRRAADPPEAAGFLVTRKRAHYLFTVKANQPTLLARCAGLPWHRMPVADRTATAATAASSCAPSRASVSATSGSRTPPRSSRSPARPAARTPTGGGL